MSEIRRREEKKEELRNARTGYGHEEGINDLRLPSEPNPFPPFLINSRVLRLLFAIDNSRMLPSLLNLLKCCLAEMKKKINEINTER